LNKDFLDLLLGGLIDKLLVKSNNGLGKSLTDGVDLRDVTCKEKVCNDEKERKVRTFTLCGMDSNKNLIMRTTTVDTDANINVAEAFLTEKKNNFVDLELHDLGFKELDRGTIDTNETLSALAVSDGGGGFL
jgi:hypothetical protein